jgi:hypothetical protein
LFAYFAWFAVDDFGDGFAWLVGLSRRLAAPEHRDGGSTAKAEVMKIKILENIQAVKPLCEFVFDFGEEGGGEPGKIGSAI